MDLVTPPPATPLDLPELPELPDLAPQPVTLRPWRPADGPAAFVVAQEALAGGWDAAALAGWRARWAAGERDWWGHVSRLAGERAVAAVVAPDGPLVGFARVVADPVRRVEQLTDLYVRPAFWRGQVGRHLLAAVLAPTPPPGWRRVIIANPVAPALALYLRWGVVPLGGAWFLRLPADVTRPVALGAGIRPLVWPADAAALEGLAGDLALPHRAALHGFLATRPAARGLARERAGAVTGFGWREDDLIGPVLGATPADTVALVAALLAEARAAGVTAPGLWAPGANVALLGWLRDHAPRLTLAGQVTILADAPATLAALDRLVLPGRPYLLS